MAEGVKGTVTSLADLFSVEEAQNAARRVEEAIAEKQNELDQLHHFISDNNNLLKLVQRLPDELFQDVMVPFGKGAFFPGRLIHTNEFLVLLGEGYYAERTSKQTVDILQRRGKALDSQVDSFKAIMLDLKAEASFFDTTATEATEGLVEIRENYNEELPSGRMSNLAGSSEDTSMKISDDDEEYARIMSRLDELEREEVAAEGINEGDEDEDSEADFGCSLSQDYFDRSLKISEDQQPRDQLKLLEDKNLHTAKALTGDRSQQKYSDQFISSTATPKSAIDSVKVPTSTTTGPSRKIADTSMAFTGSIIEHGHGIQTNPAGQCATSQTPSKPVSRFKMQKGGR